MYWALTIVFLFCGACHSKTVQTEAAPPASQSEKVTTTPANPPLEVFMLVDLAPRMTNEIREAFVLNSSIQDCVRNHYSGTPLQFSMEGRVNYSGKVERLKLVGAENAFGVCLSEAIKTVTLGRGKIGQFKIRWSTSAEQLPGAKGFIIGPKEDKPGKKFE